MSSMVRRSTVVPPIACMSDSAPPASPELMWGDLPETTASTRSNPRTKGYTRSAEPGVQERRLNPGEPERIHQARSRGDLGIVQAAALGFANGGCDQHATATPGTPSMKNAVLQPQASLA